MKNCAKNVIIKKRNNRFSAVKIRQRHGSENKIPRYHDYEETHSMVRSIMENDEHMVRFLLKKGYSPNKEEIDSFGCTTTPLIAAIEKGNYELAVLLLRLGAWPDKRNGLKVRPIDYAAQAGNWKMFNLFLKRSVKVSGSTLINAIEGGNHSIIRFCITHGAPVDTRDGSGWTPLMMASAINNAPAVTLLIENGADIKAADPDGWDSFMIAEKNKANAVIEILHAKKAELSRLEEQKKARRESELKEKLMMEPVSVSEPKRPRKSYSMDIPEGNIRYVRSRSGHIMIYYC